MVSVMVSAVVTFELKLVGFDCYAETVAVAVVVVAVVVVAVVVVAGAVVAGAVVAAVVVVAGAVVAGAVVAGAPVANLSQYYRLLLLLVLLELVWFGSV